jgi:simple sugar transport system substrate-binding protein
MTRTQQEERKMIVGGFKYAALAALFAMASVLGAHAASTQTKKYKFDIIVHDGSTSFYAPVINGMNIACAQISAECKFLGPPNGSDIAAEVDLIENAINSGVDAIIMDIPNEKAMEKVTAEAAAKNVGVYFIGTAYPHTPYGSIGQNFYAAGKVEGSQIIKYLPGGGKVAIVTCCAGNVPLEQRAQGAIDTLKANGKFQVVGPTLISTDETQAYSAIEALYEANPDLKGIFGTDATTEVIGRFIQKNGLAGKVIGGGFDLVPATIDAIKSGDLKFTTGQSPFLWGYLAVHQMWLQQAYGVHPISVDSGADVIDASNAGTLNPMFH